MLLDSLTVAFNGKSSESMKFNHSSIMPNNFSGLVLDVSISSSRLLMVALNSTARDEEHHHATEQGRPSGARKDPAEATTANERTAMERNIVANATTRARAALNNSKTQQTKNNALLHIMPVFKTVSPQGHADQRSQN